MCEIDVSEIWNADCTHMSASRAELGDNAGQVTWLNCLKFAELHPLINDQNRDAARGHFREYGAWTKEEILAWSDLELAALIWQEAACSMREFEEYCDGDYEKYLTAQEAGQVSGRLTLTPNSAWFYLGL